MPGPPRQAYCRRVLVSSLGLLCALTIAVPSVASEPPAPPPSDAGGLVSPTSPRSQTLGNPLLGRPWGVYRGPLEHSWHAYRTATGEQRALLGRIALEPKATWFGQWLRLDRVAKNVRKYVRNSQHGNPEALVQMAIFAIQPWEHEACHRLPTPAEKDLYKRWVDRVADALGAAHVALMLQPDAPFALCAPHDSQALLRMMRYATERFAAQPNTHVYIEAGAADWLRDDPRRAVQILIPAGVASARGFALNSTHYDSTARQVRFAAAISEELAARGIPDKYAVVNTAQNGRPFKGYTYGGPNFDNARACADRDDHACVTLGIPPTTDVADPAWGLSEAAAAAAATYVDGYLWFGRPWLFNQADGWDLGRALTLARTTPYADAP